MPIIGVSKISIAGLSDIKVMEIPAKVPNKAARGVNRLIVGAMKAPANNTMPSMKTQARPASQPLIGSFVCKVIGNMMTKTTMNMCGTLGPDGRAVTSSRPVFSASLFAIQA